MKKEVIIAIVLGFGLGLLITIGIWTANRVIQNEPIPTITETLSPTPEEKSTPTPSTINLEITKPENYSISAKEKVELEGSTLPGAVVVIFYEEGEEIVEVDREGNFETTISLAGGINQITVKVFDEKGSEVEKTVEVVYSTAEI